MTIILALAALAAAQAAPAAPLDHSHHNPAQHAQHQQGQHAQHQGEHKCCNEVDGKKVCTMMQGHDPKHQGHGGQQRQKGQAQTQDHAH